jgi:hypothetical protein
MALLLYIQLFNGKTFSRVLWVMGDSGIFLVLLCGAPSGELDQDA